MIRPLTPRRVTLLLTRLCRSPEVVPIHGKWFGPLPGGRSLIAPSHVLNSVAE